MKPALSPRAALLVIAGMFLLPLVLAWLMYSGTIDFKPESTRNLGQLVEPPVSISWEDIDLLPPAFQEMGGGEAGEETTQIFNEHWVILHAVPEPCDENCLREISAFRQIHLASGRHRSRIRIALLLQQSHPDEVESSLRKIHAQFLLIRASSAHFWNSLEQAAAAVQSPAGPMGSAYLIDPLGNIMMYYKAGSNPNHLKQDLKRLLTWSKLDEQ